jgi:SAM-dependent methyltransferase
MDAGVSGLRRVASDFLLLAMEKHMGLSFNQLPIRAGRFLARSLFGDNTNRCGMNNEPDRKTWLKKTLESIPSGSRILDAGAGELQFKPYCSHLNYVSQDFAQYDGIGDGNGIQTDKWDQSKLDIISDIAKIPQPDASFDAIMCIEVFEHIPHPVDVLSEFKRLLRPGGSLIITAPFCALTHFSPYFYYTGYSRNYFEYWLTKFDFSIKEIQCNGNYFEYIAQELHRVPQVGLQYAGRSATFLDRIARRLMLRYLNRLSMRNNGSENLLSFGIHVFAEKNDNPIRPEISKK